MSIAFLFPGQGSQSVGMGKALAEASPVARQTLEEVDDALGIALTRLMFEGPADELTLTANAQPAIMAASVAAIRVLEQEGGLRLADKAAFVAGHSLGEYSALAAAGTFTLADTARLLRLRGNAMQDAVEPGVGAMAALLGVTRDEADAISAEATAAGPGDVAPANDNAPGQVVVSGHKEAVERAVALAKAQGKKARMLQVSAPFHCPLMAPAAAAMEEAFKGVAIRPPAVPLIANVTAAPVTDPADIARLLVAQVTGLVRWRESVERMAADGVTQMVEFSGKVLGPMVKRITPDVPTLSIHTPADIEEALKLL